MPAPPDLLRKVELFESLSDRDLKKLADSFKESTFSAGDVIATEGQRGVGFFVISEGTVDYSDPRREGRLRAAPATTSARSR